MRYYPSVLALFFVLFSGCAALKVPPDGTYPFRASFTGSGVIQGNRVNFDGALSIVSPEHGFAQVYGPGGLAAYSADITRGEVRLYDTWGRAVREYSTPLDQLMGLIAGVPPGTRYLWRRSHDGRTSVTYTWGRLIIDEHLLPQELHVKGDPPMDMLVVQDKSTITLLMTRGSDRLRLDLDVIEGGRWMQAPLMRRE